MEIVIFRLERGWPTKQSQQGFKAPGYKYCTPLSSSPSSSSPSSSSSSPSSSSLPLDLHSTRASWVLGELVATSDLPRRSGANSSLGKCWALDGLSENSSMTDSVVRKNDHDRGPWGPLLGLGDPVGSLTGIAFWATPFPDEK